MVKTASGKNVLLQVIPPSNDAPKTYILRTSNIMRTSDLPATDNYDGDSTSQEITEQGNIGEIEDNIESPENVGEEIIEDETFLCENIYDSGNTNGDDFINEVVLEDNINEITIEQNVNEVTVDNTADFNVKEVILDSLLHNM
ncbi:hypothetical protein NQ315_006024 [Exocentrus adspersus]|uniref:Uncharacterized protein n=1 Tax=Exocentrus adspersus TaxID=1586481 RepID=A0AAV8VAV8_9CUCU|nr:hypothetical protein NQ315_006024 [Exocentrus adspersus]